MTNIKASIFAAFERMWLHVTNALSKKADKEHEHDDIYNKTEVDVLLSNKSDSDHNHDGRYEEKGASDGILTNANAYTDSQLAGKADAEHTHEVTDIIDLSSQLNTKVPTTRKINDKALDADITLSAADVGADASGSAANALNESKAYTDTEVAKKATPAQIDGKITEHNVDTAAHNDIRISLSELTTKVNNFLDVDDATTDQLSELLTLISENADDIETITNGKVNVSDIIDNLTTNVSDKPLSAAQGVALKGFINNLNAALGTKASTDDLNTLEEKVDSNWENTYQATVSRTANTVLAAPHGADGVASFRRLTEADLPDSWSYNHNLSANLDTSGWYRIYTSKYADATGIASVNFTIGHSYYYNKTEVYDFSASIGYYGEIDITQLSGVKGGEAITKVRVVWKAGESYYIDFYYNGTNINSFYVHGSGGGTFCAPTAATVPDGYSTYEFDTTTGCKSSSGFTGNLNGSINGITPEWSGSLANADTDWLAAWTSDGSKIKALNKGSLKVGYATNDGNGNNIASTYLPLSGGTMTGMLRVNNAPIFGYRYGQSNDAPAFVFDKPGSNFTGIGANNESDTIYFGAVNGTDWTWNKTYKQKWKFNGSIIADSINYADSAGYASSAGYAATATHASNGHYSIQSGNSGYYKIKINSTTSWMLCFTIRVYQGYRATDIMVSGYNYGQYYWYSPSAVLMSDSNNGSINVYFGYDSTWNLWVGIPASDYTGLDIFNVTNGYTQVSHENLFTITHQSSLTGTIQATQTIHPPYHQYGSKLLLNGTSYGTSLPSPGTVGRLFFVKVV